MNGWTRWPDVDRSRTPVGWQWPANLLVAQGPASWPRGRRALTEATEILADAVAWWDVERSGFRDGDRWLRNLGTAGGVLDLRLGSSLLANSNDPLFLAPDQFGYIYLTGVAGNSISCTAPALATSFAAYPVGGGAATTGSATGGVTFTFSTVGSWARVDLLGAGAVVVASFDGDLFTSGAATSLTDSFSVAWTINRSTSGRKSVAMPARRNGGRACMLHGSDDYMEVQDSQQHGALNFGQGDSFTVLASVRRWATQGTQSIISKKQDTSSTTGWTFTSLASDIARWYVADGTTVAFASNSGYTSGPQTVLTATRNRTLTAYRNGTAGTAATDTTRSLVNTLPMRVGRWSGSVTDAYADMEFRAAAIWRRALTTREITVLANSGIWGT